MTRCDTPMKHRQYRNEHHRLIANLHYTHSHVIGNFQQKLNPFDLSVQQYAVLRMLYDAYPNSLTVNEVKEGMTDRNSDITRLIDRLVSKQLVVREVDSENRRRVNLALNETSYRLMLDVIAQLHDFESIVKHLSSEEVSTLNALLDKVRDE